MTERGFPEKFTVDPTAPTFTAENLQTGKGLTGDEPLQRRLHLAY